MVRADASPVVFLAAIMATISFLVGSAFSLAVQPPNVLDSDLTTCACYQEDTYPSECPVSTPQLDELCADLAGYQYSPAQTEQFCSASCLDALTSCYRLHAANCSESVLDYYRTSFCSRNEEGQFCVSVGISALGSVSGIVPSCIASDSFCPTPPASCNRQFGCIIALNAVVSEFGCCAPSLLEHSLSPFANYSIGNTNVYSECGVELGDQCPEYVDILIVSSTTASFSAPSSRTLSSFLLSSTFLGFVVSSTSSDLLASSTPSDLLASNTPSDLLPSNTPSDLLVSSKTADLVVSSRPAELVVSSTPSDRPVSSTPSDLLVSSTPSYLRVSSAPSDLPVSSTSSDFLVSSTPSGLLASSKPADLVVSSAPSDRPVSSTRLDFLVSSMPSGLLVSNMPSGIPSRSSANGSVCALSFNVITFSLSVASVLCSLH